MNRTGSALAAVDIYLSQEMYANDSSF